jgi:hypothetical protein
MASLRYVPGHVIGLRDKNIEESPFEESYASAFGELIDATEFKLKEQVVQLELYLTAIGEENRLITKLQGQSGIITTSLNYLGRSQDNELGSAPGIWVQPVPYFFGYSSSGEEFNWEESMHDDDLRQVVTVDVDPEHCKQVMNSIIEGFKKTRNNELDKIQVVGISLSKDIGDFIDLYSYSFLLYQLTKFKSKISVINMSVDFGVVCLGHEVCGGNNPLPYQLALMSYSFPLFETNINLVKRNLTFEKYDENNKSSFTIMVPAFFASAGNRSNQGDVRCRLAYPAVRPETIAVTYANNTQKNSIVYPHDECDIPSTYDLKPCIAIDPSLMGVTNEKGSSFASAWLSGAYMGLATRDKLIFQLRPLSKLGYLLLFTKLCHYNNKVSDPRAYVSLYTGEQQNKNQNKTHNPFREIIVKLNEQFKVDFSITGSTVLIGEWLRINELSLQTLGEIDCTGDLGDIDFVFVGDMEQDQQHEAKEMVRDWLKEKIGRRWSTYSPYPIELHSIEARISATQLLQCVVPATHIFLTEGGLIDVWGGEDDLISNKLRLNILDDIRLWEMNPYFLTGANSLALGILLWINTILLLNLLAINAKKTPIMPDSKSLKKVKHLLNHENLRLLFGGGYPDKRERLLRRFDRGQHLLSRNKQSGSSLDEIDGILNKLKNYYLIFCQ